MPLLFKFDKILWFENRFHVIVLLRTWSINNQLGESRYFDYSDFKFKGVLNPISVQIRSNS